MQGTDRLECALLAKRDMQSITKKCIPNIHA